MHEMAQPMRAKRRRFDPGGAPLLTQNEMHPTRQMKENTMDQKAHDASSAGAASSRSTCTVVGANVKVVEFVDTRTCAAAGALAAPRYDPSDPISPAAAYADAGLASAALPESASGGCFDKIKSHAS